MIKYENILYLFCVYKTDSNMELKVKYISLLLITIYIKFIYLLYNTKFNLLSDSIIIKKME